MSKKIGLALSAGSARGLSHIGVLKVFEKHKIKIDYITGTSIGSLVGALYAAGYNAKALEEIALKTNWKNLADFTFPRFGLISGKKIERMIKKKLRNVNFKDLKIPLRIIGTDISSGKEIIFTRGKVAKAVRASISLPFFFKPVKLHKHLIVDGGLVNPVPVDQLREMGAECVIATDLTVKHERKIVGSGLPGGLKEKFVFDETKILKGIINDPTKHLISRPIDRLLSLLLRPRWLLRLFGKGKTPPIFKISFISTGIAVNQIAMDTLEKEDIDVIIKPKLKMVWSDFDRVRYAIRQGEKAAEEVVSKIKRKI